MKKISLLGLFVFLAALSANAQVVRIGLLTGIGAGGTSTSGGNLVYHLLDAAYAPSPNYDFGLYVDLATKAKVKDGGSSAEGSAGLGYGLQGKYYFMTNTFKPFVGLQAGLQSGTEAEVDADGNVINDSLVKTKFEVTPQAGFRVGPLNVWAAYRTGTGFSINGGLVWGFGNF